MSIWSKIWKGIVFVGGLVGVAAQAKARGASNAQAIAETATALAPAAAALQMMPLHRRAKDAPHE